MQLIFKVEKQKLVYLGREPIVSGSYNYLSAQFTFDDDWQGVERYAQFVKGDYAGIFRLDNNDDVCQVPWEVVNCRGQFKVTVFAATRSNEKIITANTLVINVEPSGRDDIQSEYPTQDYISKILLSVVEVDYKLDRAETLAEKAVTSADIANDAKDKVLEVAPHYQEAEQALLDIVNLEASARNSATTATTKASEASTSASNAQASATLAEQNAEIARNGATTAQTTATALTNFINTKETLTAPVVDTTLSISGAAADSKTVGDVSRKLEMLLADDVEYKVDASSYGYKKDSSATVSSVDSNSITFAGNGGYAGIKYNAKVLPNTEYILQYDLKVNTGSATFDICDSLETAQITAGGSVSHRDNKHYMIRFNSLANNEIAIRFYSVASGDSATVQNIKLTTVENSKYINTDVVVFPFIGFLNYANGNITFNAGEGWASTDYISINADYVDFCLFEFHNDSANIHLAMASFFDENYNIIDVVTENRHSNLPAEMRVNVPSNAKYARFCKRTSGYSYTPYVTLITPVKDIVVDNSIRLDNLEKGETTEGVNFKHFGYINKINLIGDSITQGVGADVPEDNSYAGILRKMFYIENDKELNYGFESFSPLVELSTVTSKMVEQVSTGKFTRTWNGTECFGSDQFTSTTVNDKFTFKVKKAFKYMKVAYKDGVAGEFKVYAGDTLLGTVITTNGTVVPKMSNAFNISAYGDNRQYSVVVVSGTVTISGVELGENVAYKTFNNYGRAGIPAQTVTGTLLEKEAECDLLIYALGTNGSISDSFMNSVASTLNNSKAKKVVLDLCMKSTYRDNLSKRNILKAFAKNINAVYISMYDVIPKDGNGYTDTSYFITDLLHPSHLGHRCIAETVARTLGLSVVSKGLVNQVTSLW